MSKFFKNKILSSNDMKLLLIYCKKKKKSPRLIRDSFSPGVKSKVRRRNIQRETGQKSVDALMTETGRSRPFANSRWRPTMKTKFARWNFVLEMIWFYALLNAGWRLRIDRLGRTGFWTGPGARTLSTQIVWTACGVRVVMISERRTLLPPAISVRVLRRILTHPPDAGTKDTSLPLDRSIGLRAYARCDARDHGRMSESEVIYSLVRNE